MCNAYNLHHRNEAILDIARAMQLELADLPYPRHRWPHLEACPLKPPEPSRPRPGLSCRPVNAPVTNGKGRS